MMLFIEMAWGNVRRNRRRSLSTLLAIAVGVCMIVFTNSFTSGISGNMSGSIIDQIDGHLRIQHKDFKKYYISDQEKILLQGWRDVAREIAALPHVTAVMPRMVVGGLVGKDEKTTTFFGTVSDLSLLATVLPDYAIHLVDGKPLSPEVPDGVLVGQLLAKSLQLKVGDELVLLSKTVHGDQSNTLVRVRGITRFPNDLAVEQSLIVGGLGKAFSENLLDLGDDTGQLVLRLDHQDRLPEVTAALENLFTTRGLPWRVTPWYENPVYARVVGMFNGIGLLVTVVLTIMVAVITSNSLLMAFFERIREIGTLRAVGMNRSGVWGLLYLESAMVGALGISAGLMVGMLLTGVMAAIGIPVGLIRQTVHPQIGLSGILVSVVAPLLCIAIAAAIPIRAATRISVVRALNHQ